MIHQLRYRFLILPAFLFIVCCGSLDVQDRVNYRQEMRDLVIAIKTYAQSQHPGFVIIPQNGHELISLDGTPTGTLSTEYLDAVDGLGREDLLYGYYTDNIATPGSIADEMILFLDKASSAGKTILVTDYCWTGTKVDDSYTRNNSKERYISFAADSRELDTIPSYPVPIYNENSNDITLLSDAENFLYLINPGTWASKNDLLNAIQTTSYDVIIMDLFFNDTALSQSDINSIRTKACGGSRLVTAYMSIGEAEDYRYYWNSNWNTTRPSWLGAANPSWPGNYKVRYWNREWQSILYGNESSYLYKIINAGFDGVYLDIIDAYEYFE
jgi:cysteinyl-tRNA synthetase